MTTTPLGPADVADLAQHLRDTEPASVETVLETAHDLPGRLDPLARRQFAGVLRRLLDTEIERSTVRRVLAEAVAIADDSPDYGLTADDLLRLITAAGLDLTQDIADAEALRIAHATAA